MRKPAIVWFILAALLEAESASAGVQVALTPASVAVEGGTEFEIRIQVTRRGSAFDGYHALVGYDSDVLRFLELPASSQEGSSMTGACGSTFHQFVASPYELEISHALVCPGVTLTGPGELYVLRFRASVQAQETLVFFSQIDFVNGGNPIPVDRIESSVVHISPATDTADSGGRASWSFVVAPNPIVSTCLFRIGTSGRVPETVIVTDVRGREVHRQAWGHGESNPSPLVWTTIDLTRQELSSGVFFVSVGNSAARSTKRIVIIR